MTEYNIRLNPNCAAAVHTGLKFKAGDKGITFRIAVDELDTTGTTAKIVFLRANGTSVESDISGTNGVYTYKTLGNEFAVPGKTIADVKFYASGNRESTASFIFEVCGDTMDGLGAGTGGYSERLEQLVSEAESAVDEAERIYNDATKTANAAKDTLNNTTAKATQTEAELKVMLIQYQNKFGEVGVLNPRSTYNSATTYEKFDLVYYGGVSWLCLKNCAGVTPAEGAYWQLFASADGGNALKLGGKSAEEYALILQGTLLTSVLAEALNLSNGVYNYRLGGGSYTGGDLPSASYAYSIARIEKRGSTDITVTLSGTAESKSADLPLAYNHYSSDGWVGWKTLATTADLANYLTLSGGKVSNGTSTPFNIKGASTNAFLGYLSSAAEPLGYLGFFGENNPVYLEKNGNTQYKLLHTGNKPFGSYTGNGSATSRTINVGGIGKGVMIISTKGMAILTNTWGMMIKDTGSITFLDTSNVAFTSDGNIKLATTNEVVNASGVPYTYAML